MQKRVSICCFVTTVICLLLWLSVVVCFAEQKNAFVKTAIKQIEPIYAGQRIPFYITLYSTARFTGVPRFELPQVSGLILMEIEERPVLGTQKNNDMEFLTKIHEFAAFPQRDGKFLIPAFTVSFARMDTGSNKAIEGTYKTDEIKIAVSRPIGTDGIDPLIATHEFKIQAAWDPKPESPKVGDAFKLTITRTVRDIPGMVLEPVRPGEIKGLRIYENPPSVEDSMERGDFSGKRREIITYVCEQEGRFEIPEVTFYWFDLEKKELKTEHLASVVLNVAPNSLYKDKDQTQGRQKSAANLVSWQAILLIITIGLGCLGFYQNRQTIARRYLAQKQHRASSEKSVFKTFETACQASNDEKTMQTLFIWLNRLMPEKRPLSIKDCFNSYHNPELIQTFLMLENRIYGASDHLQDTEYLPTDKLLNLVRQYRKHYLKQQKSQIIKHQGLKPLNP